MFLKYMGLYKCVIRPAAGREAHFDPSVGLALEAKSIQILLSNKWTVGPGGLGNGPPPFETNGWGTEREAPGQGPVCRSAAGPLPLAARRAPCTPLCTPSVHRHARRGTERRAEAYR
jgi:hypothetical protein